MPKPTINFKKNWNHKLAGSAFTTIRKPSDKYQPHRNYSVYLQNQRLGTAELVEVRTFKLKCLTDGTALIDTGYTAEKAIRILKSMHYNYVKQQGLDAPFYLLVFRYVTQQKDIFQNSKAESL